VSALLPTAKELEKLPLRAVVAYAANNAHRVTSQLRGIVPDDILDDAFRLIDNVATVPLIAELDQASIIRASERVVAAYAGAQEGMKSVQMHRTLFSLVQAALAATHAVQAAADPENAQYQMARAAVAAVRGARPAETLGGEMAIAAVNAGRRDYDALLRQYGQRDEVVVGDPIISVRDDS